MSYYVKPALIAMLAFGAGPGLPACAERSAAPQVIRFTYWANYLENQYVIKVCEAFERDNPGIAIKREWCVGDYGRRPRIP